MGQLVRLGGNRVHNHRVIVTQRIDADAACKVNILFPLHVPKRRALAVVERNREAPVGIHYILLFFRFQFLISHLESLDSENNTPTGSSPPQRG